MLIQVKITYLTLTKLIEPGGFLARNSVFTSQTKYKNSVRVKQQLLESTYPLSDLNPIILERAM